MHLALIVGNKSMRHSLGRRVGGGVGRFSRAPMIHLTLYVSALLQSLLPCYIFPTPLSCYLFSLCAFFFSPSLIFGSDRSSDIGTNTSPDAYKVAGLKAIFTDTAAVKSAPLVYENMCVCVCV